MQPRRGQPKHERIGSSSHHSKRASHRSLKSQSNDEQTVENTLKMLGVERKYIHRAIKVYEKHYGQKYDIEVIIEIIYRLKVKDKLKYQKRQQYIFESRQNVENVLLSMDFSPYYVKKGIAEYAAYKHKARSNYNLEIIIEIIMNIRAKDREQHHDHAQRKFYVGKMITSKNLQKEQYKNRQKSNDPNDTISPSQPSTQHLISPSDEFVMYQKMLSMGYDNGTAFDASYHNPSSLQQTVHFAKVNKVHHSHHSHYQHPHHPHYDDKHEDDIKVREQSHEYHDYHQHDASNEHNEYNANNNYYDDEYLREEEDSQFQEEPKFVAIEQNEKFQVDSCDFTVSGCNSFRRINYFLFKYNEWLFDDENNKTKEIGFFQILNRNYSNSALLDDFHHSIYYHDFDQIYKNLYIKCFEENPNHLIGCKCLIRNNRDRLSKHYKYNLYFNNNATETNAEQIMDFIHCYFLHSYHLGLILTPNEFASIHSKRDKHDSDEEDEEEDDEDDSNDMMGNTLRIQNIQKIVNAKRKRIEYLRGTERLFNNNKFVTKFKDDRDRDLLIDKNGQIGIEFEYYDKNKSLYVAPKYNSFREEILNLIPIDEFKILTIRAQNFKNKKYSKWLNADDMENGSRIQEGSTMYLEHLLAIMIYCNFDVIQTEFVETCIDTIHDHDLSNYDDDDEEKDDEEKIKEMLIKRHRRFCHLGKRLYETVWSFGSTTNKSDLFYCGLSKIGQTNGTICFSSTVNCISLPLSTSSKIEVVLNYAGCYRENQGIIMELKQNAVYSTMKYFDTEWISDHGAESELLFFGNDLVNNHTFTINSIISIKSSTDHNCLYGEDYRDYLICLNIIDKIFNAGYYFGISDLDEVIVDSTVDLLNSELQHDIPDHIDHEYIPSYIKHLIHIYCQNLTLIKINWPDILHYYSFITSFLCYKQNLFINLRVICPIFRNCQKIHIHGGNPSLMILNHNKMDYIYSFLYQNRNRINLKQISITSISANSTLSFASCIKQYKQRFNKIHCEIFIQNPKVFGAPNSLIIRTC